MSWEKDKRWSDGFLPEIKRNLGEYLIGEPENVEEDQMRNTDLIVLKMEAVRVACRVRKFEYHARYGSEFTMRATRPSGAETELSKVVKGWGDYIFYGFADQAERRLHAWFLGDLNVFRGWWSDTLFKRQEPGMLQHNGDGSSKFRVFDVRQLPGEFLVGYGGAVVAVA